jgi:hypothetical protein
MNFLLLVGNLYILRCLWLYLIDAMGVLTALHHEYYLNSSDGMSTVVKFQLTDQMFVIFCSRLFVIVFLPCVNSFLLY